MNILFVSAVLPYPLLSGGQVRIYNLIRELSREHSIFLLSFIRDTKEAQYVKNLQFCKIVKLVFRGRAWQRKYITKSVFSSFPLLYTSYESTEMQKLINESIQNYSIDLLHLEPSYIWLSLKEKKVPVIVSEHNIEYKVYEQYASQVSFIPARPILSIDVIKHKYWENFVWNHCDHVTAVSQPDADIIKKNAQHTPVSVVPNGVDTNKFTFRLKKINRNVPMFLFVGNFSWIENKDAIVFLRDQIWPAVKKIVPMARLRIVGRNLDKRIKNQLLSINAEVRESVEDILSEYHDADALLAPIRVGGGTKFKILEAMASGLPVVTTAKGAEGLPVLHNTHVLIANTPYEFALSLDLLLKNEKIVSSLVTNSHHVISEEYSWKNIARKLNSVWKSTYENSH